VEITRVQKANRGTEEISRTNKEVLAGAGERTRQRGGKA
jgi:hypothetical protein